MGIELSKVREELMKECYLVCGKDNKGNAVVAFKISKFNKKECNVAVMMKSLMVLIDSVCSDLDVLRGGIVLLFDMKGLNKDNFMIDLQKVFIKAFQDRYPIRIKQFIVFQAPIIIRGGIKIAKVILSKKLSGRIVSVKSKEELNKMIEDGNLPPILGGTANESSAWDYVLNVSTNAIDLMEESQKEEKSEDDDSEWMKEKTMAFEKGKTNKKSNRMSKIMVFGKNKLSSAKTKIIESKSKIKQKRDERKLKKQKEENENQASDDEKGDDLYDSKKPKSLPFKKREEPVTKTENVNEEEEPINEVEKVEKVDDKPKQETADDDQKEAVDNKNEE